LGFKQLFTLGFVQKQIAIQLERVVEFERIDCEKVKNIVKTLDALLCICRLGYRTAFCYDIIFQIGPTYLPLNLDKQCAIEWMFQARKLLRDMRYLLESDSKVNFQIPIQMIRYAG
jgi:hypothetical protein